MFKKVMVWFLIVVGVVILVVAVVGFIISAPGYEGPQSNHFNGKTFQNLNPVKAKGFKDVLKWSLNRDQGEWHEVENFEFGEKPVRRIEGDSIKVTFVNHATFLVQMQGVNILTDPVWSERTSPFSFLGPKRAVPPGIRFEDLPDIDIVIISHNHYDHLDVSTLKRLEKEYQPKFFVPLGVSQFLKNHGIETSADMDWWEERKITETLQLACVPAQHFSGRGLYDRDKTLWAGFVMSTPSGAVYFVGDTGYGDFFTRIGKKYGPVKLALIPIGAYKPAWFMSPIHISPEEAVKVHLDVGAQKSIGMHYGTFPLADDGMHEPVRDLNKAIERHNLEEGTFLALKNGESIFIK